MDLLWGINIYRFFNQFIDFIENIDFMGNICVEIYENDNLYNDNASKSFLGS